MIRQMAAATINLTRSQVRSLEDLVTADDVAPRVAWRARLVLDRAASDSDEAVAERHGTARATVRLWRRRFAEQGPEGLRDRPRPGRPSVLEPSAEESNGTSLVDVTLERLLAAASRTISRRGFAATRMGDIAREAGVSTATLHYYFRTRQEILVRSLLWSNERLVAQLAHATDKQDRPLVRLAKFIERTIPYPGTQCDEYLLEIDLWSQVRLHRELLPAWESFAERWIDHLRQIIADGIADGSFTTTAPAAEIAERIVAMTDGFSAQAGIGSSRMPPTRARELLLRFAAEQLGVPARRVERHAHIPGISRRPSDPSGDAARPQSERR